MATSLLHEQRHLFASGIRLLGVGVSGFTQVAQEALFEVSAARTDESRVEMSEPTVRHSHLKYRPGDDVAHDEWGSGWVWGTGLGLVTVRFETANTPVGRIRTFAEDDPQLHPTPVVVPSEDDPTGPGWLEA